MICAEVKRSTQSGAEATKAGAASKASAGEQGSAADEKDGIAARVLLATRVSRRDIAGARTVVQEQLGVGSDLLPMGCAGALAFADRLHDAATTPLGSRAAATNDGVLFDAISATETGAPLPPAAGEHEFNEAVGAVNDEVAKYMGGFQELWVVAARGASREYG